MKTIIIWKVFAAHVIFMNGILSDWLKYENDVYKEIASKKIKNHVIFMNGILSEWLKYENDIYWEVFLKKLHGSR